MIRALAWRTALLDKIKEICLCTLDYKELKMILRSNPQGSWPLEIDVDVFHRHIDAGLERFLYDLGFERYTDLQQVHILEQDYDPSILRKPASWREGHENDRSWGR
jgi:hypothetical protein